MQLYYHKTDGGAEYLTDKYIECENGHKEGIFEGATYIVRIDGDITKDAELTVREDDNVIAMKWHIDDVKSIASDLTDDQCREVLARAKQSFDASVGINWDVLEIHADEVRREAEAKKEEVKQ